MERATGVRPRDPIKGTPRLHIRRRVRGLQIMGTASERADDDEQEDIGSARRRWRGHPPFGECGHCKHAEHASFHRRPAPVKTNKIDRLLPIE